MILSEHEVREFIKLKKQLRFERYRLLISLFLVFSSILTHIFIGHLEIVLSILTLMILIEVSLSKKSQELIAIYERGLSLSAENITLRSKI